MVVSRRISLHVVIICWWFWFDHLFFVKYVISIALLQFSFPLKCTISQFCIGMWITQPDPWFCSVFLAGVEIAVFILFPLCVKKIFIFFPLNICFVCVHCTFLNSSRLLWFSVCAFHVYVCVRMRECIPFIPSIKPIHREKASFRCNYKIFSISVSIVNNFMGFRC